jgi:hypothetical protein
MNDTKVRTKTIVISVFHSFISKNILNAGVLDLLLAKDNIRVVLLVLKEKEEFYKEQYADERISVEGMDTEALLAHPLEKFFRILAWHCIDSVYHRYKRMEKCDAQKSFVGWVEYYFTSTIVWILSLLKPLHILIRILERQLLKSGAFFEVLLRYDPELVFATDVFDPRDAILLREASKVSIPTVGMVRSWDNCFSKGLMRTLPDRLLTNSRHIKGEACDIHGMSFQSIEVVGLPQFDRFVTEKRMERDEFFKNIGADPQTELVVFAPAGSLLSDTDWQIYEILATAREEGKFAKPITIYVRNHPHHPADFSQTKIRKGDIVERPGHVFEGDNPKETELTKNDSAFLADLLAHSSIVIWIATTLALDASVFNRPLISVNFDGLEKLPYINSVKRYHDDDHMRKLLKTGGVFVANTREELINGVGAYLSDPTLDQDGRKLIIDEQLYKLDGKSSERIVNALLIQQK